VFIARLSGELLRSRDVTSRTQLASFASLLALLAVGCPVASEAPDAPTDAPADAPLDAYAAPITLDDDATAALDPSQLFAGPMACRPPVLVRVVHVTDGDTMRVESVDTRVIETVRFTAINTPEVAHIAGQVDECYGPEATTFTYALLNHLVWLTFDASCVDPYMRTLAYVHVGPSPEGFWQRQLMRRGLARAYIIGRNRALEGNATADQATAIAESRGMWAACF
jgi:endonuclease YncB( thermonuclease family)